MDSVLSTGVSGLALGLAAEKVEDAVVVTFTDIPN